jgi:hypothetical protein
MEVGDKIGNFILVEKIDSIMDLIDYLNNEKSIFWRHRVHPTAFFMSWHLRLILNTLNGGHFFKIKKINK